MIGQQPSPGCSGGFGPSTYKCSKRIKGKQGVTDKSAKFGPPDKNEHFTTPLLDSDDNFESPPPSKKVKENDGEKRKVVEVLYSDGIWVAIIV